MASDIGTLFEAMDEGYLLVDVIFDEAGRAVDIEYVEANPAAMRMIGDDMTGRRVSESGVDYEPYWYEVWGRVARTGKGERLERYAAPLKRWFAFFVFKPAPGDHESRRVAVVFHDVTERRNAESAERAGAEAAPHESAEQFRQFGDASCDVLWIRDASTLQWEYLSPAFETIYGEAREDVLKGDNLASWADLVVSEDRQKALANIGRVRSGEHVTFEYRIQRPSDGEIRWLRNTDFPLVDEAGRVRRIGGISHDVTGEKAAAERVMVMVAELQHRTRNLIAVVRSIISHTLASSPSPDGFKLRIDDRLSALSRVQGLLSRSGQEPITIGALVRLELAALSRDVQRERVDIAGPEVRLRSSIVQTLALALHELAANARKHGALSGGQGRLQIAWRMEQRDKAAWLVLSWVEENARRADAPPAHKGFGRELIEDALLYSLGAETRYELDETGLRCSIALPLGTDGRQERLS